MHTCLNCIIFSYAYTKAIHLTACLTTITGRNAWSNTNSSFWLLMQTALTFYCVQKVKNAHAYIRTYICSLYVAIVYTALAKRLFQVSNT